MQNFRVSGGEGRRAHSEIIKNFAPLSHAKFQEDTARPAHHTRYILFSFFLFFKKIIILHAIEPVRSSHKSTMFALIQSNLSKTVTYGTSQSQSVRLRHALRRTPL